MQRGCRSGNAPATPMKPRLSPGWIYVLPGLFWVAAFFFAPLIVMLFESFKPPVGATGDAAAMFGAYRQIIGNPDIVKAFQNSLEVTALVTVLSILIAYPVAYVLADIVPDRWQRMVLILLVLPFWTSYVVRSYAWVLVLASNGVINKSLLGLGLIDAPLTLANTRGATVVGFVHFFVMLLTLTIYANLVQIPKNYARAARDLGASSLSVFWHITLPLSLPGIMVGAFLTFVLCIGDYITPQILGGNNELLAPQIVMMQIGRRADFPTASAISLALMVIVTLAYAASARWLKLERA
jgi:spermidine/putrescine transport system permease protein